MLRPNTIDDRCRRDRLLDLSRQIRRTEAQLIRLEQHRDELLDEIDGDAAAGLAALDAAIADAMGGGGRPQIPQMTQMSRGTEGRGGEVAERWDGLS